MDFGGDYVGRIDGRRADLQIRVTRGSDAGRTFVLSIHLKDLDRQAEFEGEHRHRARPGHVLRDVRLQASGGSGAKEWRVVHLHTQDIRFLSGVSVWRGTDYGFWFERTD